MPPPEPPARDAVISDRCVDRRQLADRIDAAAGLAGVVEGDRAVDERQGPVQIIGDAATVERRVVVGDRAGGDRGRAVIEDRAAIEDPRPRCRRCS